jgi:hypothetical protein
MSYPNPYLSPSGATFAQLQAGGLSNLLERLITVNGPAESPPTTAVTISATGGGQSINNPSSAITVTNNGGSRTIAKPSTQATVAVGAATTGSLPAGTYYVGYTVVTANGGETTLGSSVSTVFTVTAGLTPVVTLPALPTGGVSMNLYLSNTNGSNTALVKYATGITNTTFTLNSANWNGTTFANGISPPTVNSTIGPIPVGTYYAAVTQYHLHGETTIGSSASTSFTIAANSAPSGAPTGVATTGTGTLAAAATGYFYQVTYVDAWGNETTGVENASVTALSATGEITVTFHDTAPDWVVTRNFYLSPANGASGSETLYATGISATATTYVANVNLWFNNTIPQASARVVPTTGTSAAQAPSFSLPSVATGSQGLRLYLSNTGGTNTAFALYATGIQATTYYATTAPWNGTTFANGTVPPTKNTTVGIFPPGAYYANFTETNGYGETTASTESASFTITSQSNPSNAATGAASGSSGSLPAGAYFFSYAYVDANGNTTTVGTTEVASAVTIAATNTLTVTFNDTLPGWATGRNLYLTAAGGASGSETLYATGITASTYACNSATWAGTTSIPATNTTSVDVPRFTFPALQTGNVARNLYVTAAGGSTGTEVLYATGITTTTFDGTIAPPSNSFAVPLPTFNSTAFTYKDPNGNVVCFAESNIRAAERGNLQTVYSAAAITLDRWLRGDPISSHGIIEKLRHAHVAFAVIAQAFSDAGTLVDANPGTIRPATSGNAGTASTVRRSWP